WAPKTRMPTVAWAGRFSTTVVSALWAAAMRVVPVPSGSRMEPEASRTSISEPISSSAGWACAAGAVRVPAARAGAVGMARVLGRFISVLSVASAKEHGCGDAATDDQQPTKSREGQCGAAGARILVGCGLGHRGIWSRLRGGGVAGRAGLLAGLGGRAGFLGV